MTDKPSYEELLDSFHDQQLLIEIGRELMRERDTDRLLRRILAVSRHITGADAGSVFLAEEAEGRSLLRFKYSHTVSMDLPYEEFTMPRTTGSIAGYVSLTGKALNIPDVYALPESLPFSFNDSFDLAHGYLTKSMLTVPMTDHTGLIVGVIQLINSKETDHSYAVDPDGILLKTHQDFQNLVVPFKERYIPLMEAVAAQAAIALENAAMIKRIRKQFEQFVRAAVEAVEERDPATSGHSYRVAELAVELARAVNARESGSGGTAPFSDTALKELEYAGLLHDFGKVYIDPAIFLKAKKLFPGDFERLKLRLKYLRRSLELDYALRRTDLENAAVAALDEERDRSIREMLDISATIETLNEPAVSAEDPDELLGRILASSLPAVRGVDGESIPILTEEEAANLRIRRGSLNTRERLEIERHVVRSYEFVKRIPWPKEFEKIPLYVKGHHEMLDGSGYPDGLKGDELPLQSRILAVADIYDALTASDRPYKKAVPRERALAILADEVRRGRLDGELVSLMETLPFVQKS